MTRTAVASRPCHDDAVGPSIFVPSSQPVILKLHATWAFSPSLLKGSHLWRDQHKLRDARIDVVSRQKLSHDTEESQRCDNSI